MTDSSEDAAPDIDPADAPEPPEPPELPGRRLRETREARGLSIADVAQSLKFSPRQIEALEGDDMSVLPGATFVRGFIRSYARFLKLDDEALLATVESRVPPVLSDVRAPQSIGSATPASALRQIPLLVASSVVLLVAAAVVGAWHFLGDQEPAPAPAAQSSARGEQAPAEAGSRAAAADGAPAPDARQLVFEVREKSWIEVTDATQQVLLTGEFPAGSRQSLSGRPPFALVIGNASKVGVTIGGQPVDLAPHVRADVARLTLQ